MSAAPRTAPPMRRNAPRISTASAICSAGADQVQIDGLPREALARRARDERAQMDRHDHGVEHRHGAREGLVARPAPAHRQAQHEGGRDGAGAQRPDVEVAELPAELGQPRVLEAPQPDRARQEERPPAERQRARPRRHRLPRLVFLCAEHRGAGAACPAESRRPGAAGAGWRRGVTARGDSHASHRPQGRSWASARVGPGARRSECRSGEGAPQRPAGLDGPCRARQPPRASSRLGVGEVVLVHGLDGVDLAGAHADVVGDHEPREARRRR